MPSSHSTNPKNAKYIQSDACQKAFHELKQWLTSEPTITIPDDTGSFVVYIDASSTGLGCVVMRHGKMVAYEPRQLKDHEKNYPTYYLELAAVIFALKIWRHISSEKFEVDTEH